MQKILSSLVDYDSIEYSNIHISFVNSHSNSTQIGELLYQILPAAYTQAVSQALGSTMDHLPLQTDSMYKQLLAKQHQVELLRMKMEQKIPDENEEVEE